MTEPVDLTAPRLACNICKGTGLSHHDAFDFREDDGTVKHYAATDHPCNACDASGYFTPPDVADILVRIVAKQGKNKGKLRASFVSPAMGRNPTPAMRQEQVKGERAYYVWRMARFHGGADTTMPMTASLFSRGDPYREILDALADKVAERSFGTSLGAAAVWGPALMGSDYKGPTSLDLLLG